MRSIGAGPTTTDVGTCHGGAVAWVDVRTAAAARWGRPTNVSTFAYALRKVSQSVRGGDRVCPASTTLVAVSFGPVAGAVPLRVLGDRLARAIGPGLLFEHAESGLTTAVGLSSPGVGPAAHAPAEVARRALAACRSARTALDHDPAEDPASAAVTVERRGGRDDRAATPAPLPVRTTRRYLANRVDGVPELRPADRRHGRAADGRSRPVSTRCVLVIDPMATTAHPPGFAVAATAALVERLGSHTGIAAVSPDEPLAMTVDGVNVDLVILVLDGAWVGRSPSWADGAWGLPARLTTAYVDKGVPVLAVSAGAGAGAIASCVAQGGLALFDPDRMAEALRSLEGLSAEEARQIAELDFPDRFHALLVLTAGERRVLFYLTEGWSAQDIAEDLVVSLTTVRSHIRSVLRKLGVRSQLAAVAVANSRDLEHQQLSDGD